MRTKWSVNFWKSIALAWGRLSSDCLTFLSITKGIKDISLYTY
jgi:hypothetical protein